VILALTPGCASSHGMAWARTMAPAHHCFLNSSLFGSGAHSAFRSSTVVMAQMSITTGSGTAVGAGVAVTTWLTISVSLTTEVSLTVTTWVWITSTVCGVQAANRL